MAAVRSSRNQAVRMPSRAASMGLPRINREYRTGDSHGKSPDRERGHNAASISLSPTSTGLSAPKHDPEKHALELIGGGRRFSTRQTRSVGAANMLLQAKSIAA